MSENATWVERQGKVDNVYYTAVLNGFRLSVQAFKGYVRWVVVPNIPNADTIATGKTGSIEHAKQIAVFAVPQFGNEATP